MSGPSRGHVSQPSGLRPKSRRLTAEFLGGGRDPSLPPARFSPTRMSLGHDSEDLVKTGTRVTKLLTGLT